MKNKTYNVLNNKVTKQSEPIPNKEMVKNNAGGYVFKLDKFKQLERFLILGTVGGTYYVKERPLTLENAKIVQDCFNEDPQRTIKIIVDISDSGRAHKNDQALFSLAIGASYRSNMLVRQLALHALPKVARISTHLFHFASYLDGMRGWGRAVRHALDIWYTTKSTNSLALQLAKYQQRDGWSHRDMLRLAHVKPETNEQKDLFAWAVGKPYEKVYGLVEALEKMKVAKSEDEVVALIHEYKAPAEIIPTEYKKSAKVWEALLPNLGLTAIIRNLGNMGSCGLLKQGNFDAIEYIVRTLTDEEKLKKERIHPIQGVLAYLTYGSGKGFRGNNYWEVVPQIVDALQSMIYKSFKYVESTGKSFYLGVDVSGSMGSPLSGIEQMSCAQGASIMAMTIARTEPRYIIKGFTSSGGYYSRDTQMSKLNITPNTPLEAVFNAVRHINFGATDCALPILDALNNKLYVDAFIVITDNETWAGKIHPSQALKQYRNTINPNAKMIVIGMTSTGFSIADQNDPLSLDVVGFDTNTPSVISEFVRD